MPKPYHTPKSERDESLGELTELEELAGLYSDAYKSVYGFRPRGPVQWGVADYRDALDDLTHEADLQRRAEAAREYETRTWKRLEGERERVPTQGIGWKLS